MQGTGAEQGDEMQGKRRRARQAPPRTATKCKKQGPRKAIEVGRYDIAANKNPEKNDRNQGCIYE
jgi:hypothetical protein